MRNDIELYLEHKLTDSVMFQIVKCYIPLLNTNKQRVNT